jgi:hypothetical protein
VKLDEQEALGLGVCLSPLLSTAAAPPPAVAQVKEVLGAEIRLSD